MIIFILIALTVSWIFLYNNKNAVLLNDGERVNMCIKVAVGTFAWCILMYVVAFVFQWYKSPDLSVNLESVKSLWWGGDNEHYMKIAENWYVTEGDDKLKMVFLPFYPILIRLMHFIVRDYYYAAVIVSFLSAIGSSVFLYKLIKLDYEDNISTDAVLFMLIFPFSFFMVTANSESVFMLVSLSTVYFARKNKWILASVLGFCATFTKYMGLVLFGLVLYEYVFQSYLNRKWSWKGLLIPLIPCGYGVYLLINKLIFNDWFKYIEFQKHWGQEIGFFGKNLVEMYKYGVQSYGRIFLMYGPQIVMFFLFIGLTVYCIKKKVRTSYILYMIVYFIMTYTPTMLISGGRYLWANFPIYIGFALMARDKRIGVLLKVSFGILLMFYTYAYTQHMGIW